ncbi:MAG: Rieske 2Fe-2S domain-containing protein [Pseudomonadota bacterium]
MSVSCAGRLHDVFLVRSVAGVFGYLNSCPHTGAPLDWMPDQFLSPDRDLIQCSMHAALFNLHDGQCIAGPCVGQALLLLPLYMDGESVFIQQREFCARLQLAGRA